MGITMVTESRQKGWNPCAENNGGCQMLCFFKFSNYSCSCPEGVICSPGSLSNTAFNNFNSRIGNNFSEPKAWVPLKLIGKDYNLDDEQDYYDISDDMDLSTPAVLSDSTNLAFIMTLFLLICIFMVIVTFTFIVLVYRKRKKKFVYSNGRSVMTFANPNYYTSSGEAVIPINSTGADKKAFIWKRLKYDKSQVSYKKSSGSNNVLHPTVISRIA